MSKESEEEKHAVFVTPPYCKTKCKDTGLVFEEDEIPLSTLEISDPGHVLRLCENLTDRSTNRLELKINRYLKLETLSEMVFMINLLTVSEEAVINVLYDKILDSPKRTPLADDTIGNIIKYKDECLICAETLDPKIQGLIDEVIPKGSGDLTIVPIVAKEQRTNVPNRYAMCPVYLICFLNSRKDTHYISSLVNETFRYCLAILLNTRECEEERRLKQQCQSLLTVARKLFSHLGDLSDLLKEIMSEARRLTNAERCSLFLLDPDHMHLVAKVFDGVSSAEKSQEVRIAKDQGIAALGRLLTNVFLPGNGPVLNGYPCRRFIYFTEMIPLSILKLQNLASFKTSVQRAAMQQTCCRQRRSLY
ncbi:unnamed protein product [Acanthoscelides obtectus]|uniref:Uncharacterized protein n=1 Tax=Acanthoscelides obtectus TaxID=200917 RepID=A0A9P0M674_ACAOB|nr:unnamed protein product [Acanthoscelides obtectus]CAK1679575.1 cGMP-dependent 3',5'-cyclic phosphodiesterase [Acanthoscelides obtectus]